MTPDEFWVHEFGNIQYTKDFAGKQINKRSYKDGSAYQWDLDHILPLEFKKEGKPDNINNWQITHVTTNRQKANQNPFVIDGKKYQIKRVKNLYEEDIIAPYPYEENGKKYCIVILEENL
jgi:CRISPR/Cas system Type II protein with McrA/HNH and RuvC-like nuclease domain